MDALRGYSAGWLTMPVQSTLSGKASGFCLQNIRGTDDETRTHTACATTPSRWRVYQFHHVGASACLHKLSFYVFRRTVTMFCIKHISFILQSQDEVQRLCNKPVPRAARVFRVLRRCRVLRLLRGSDTRGAAEGAGYDGRARQSVRHMPRSTRRRNAQ